MEMIQLDLFQEYNELYEMKEQIKSLKESNDKVRKKLFAEHGKLAKMYLQLHNEFEDWKMIVARGHCKI
jgi:bacterioferritin (cytochrome b1)